MLLPGLFVIVGLILLVCWGWRGMRK